MCKSFSACVFVKHIFRFSLTVREKCNRARYLFNTLIFFIVHWGFLEFDCLFIAIFELTAKFCSLDFFYDQTISKTPLRIQYGAKVLSQSENLALGQKNKMAQTHQDGKLTLDARRTRVRLFVGGC